MRLGWLAPWLVRTGERDAGAMNSTLRGVRVDETASSAYDENAAVIFVDRDFVGRVSLGESKDFPVPAGHHEVRVRLGLNFLARRITVDAPEGGAVVVTCTKARSARDPRNLVHPSRYWSLTVS